VSAFLFFISKATKSALFEISWRAFIQL
jgi:hypothetical protein